MKHHLSSEEEVFATLGEFSDDKAPGPDGFPWHFDREFGILLKYSFVHHF